MKGSTFVKITTQVSSFSELIVLLFETFCNYFTDFLLFFLVLLNVGCKVLSLQVSHHILIQGLLGSKALVSFLRWD